MELGGGFAQSAEVMHGSPRPPALPPPVLELLLAPLDPLALLLLDPLVPLDPPAPLLLDPLAPPPPPLATLLLDASPPLSEDEVAAAPDAPPADVVAAPVVEGSLSPHPGASPRTSEEIPARTEADAKRDAEKRERGMIAIVPPSLDRLART